MAAGQNSAEAAAQQQAGASGLEEIVVTAERREEKLSKVPIDISTFKADELQSAGISDAIALPLLVPTLVQVRGPNADAYETPFIRGVGSSSTQPGDDASVATYVDGVYQADKTANIFDLNDIDHIEVLKGPQGTLFGRNATGGAISVITKRPSFAATEFSGEASYGSYDETIDKAYLTGPITDTLAASVSASYHSGGNFIRDTIDNSRLGGSQGTSVTAKLLWLPNDSLEVTLSAILNNEIEHFASTGIAVVPGTVPVGGLFYGGKYSTNPNSYSGDFVSYTRQKNIQPQLHIKYSFDDFDVSSTTAYTNANNATPYDYDSTSASVFYFLNPHQVTRSWSQEFQINSTYDSPFQWVGGLYYSDDTQGQEPVLYISGAATPAAPADFLASSCTARGAAGCNVAAVNAAANDQAFAAFGEASYAITPEDKVTVGLRYTEERKKLQGQEDLEVPLAGPNDNVPTGSAFPLPGFAGITLVDADAHTTYRKPTWRFAYGHDFDENVHAYFSYNRGFKSGAYNLSSLSQPPVSPEVIDAFEIGLKSTWFDRHLQLSPSLYYYNYSNLQVQKVAGGIVTVQNAGAAKLYGLDMDWAFLPIDALRVHGSLSLEHSEYSPYANASSFGFAPGFGHDFGVQTTVDATGHSLIYAPIYAFNIGVSYSFNLPGNSSLSFDSNLAYTGKYEQVAAAEGNYIFPHEDLSASLTWTSPGQDYYGRVYGRNLTDLRVVGTQLNTVGYFLELQQPRVIGVAIGVKLDYPAGPPETPQAAYVPPPAQAPAPALTTARSYMVFFDFNKSDLTPQGAAIVDQAAKNAGPAKATQLVVTGHTDTVGSDAYNMRLSRRRAESVAAELEKQGISSGEIEIVAKGKHDLLVPTGDGVREPQNRRVQIVYEGNAGA